MSVAFPKTGRSQYSHFQQEQKDSVFPVKQTCEELRLQLIEEEIKSVFKVIKYNFRKPS